MKGKRRPWEKLGTNNGKVTKARNKKNLNKEKGVGVGGEKKN